MVTAYDFYYNMTDSSFHRVLISVISNLSEIYPTSVLVLFCLACNVSATMFQSIQKLIDQSTQNHQTLDSMIKKRHLLACELVDCLNNIFGMQLLLTTAFLFLSIINSSFYTLGENMESATGLFCIIVSSIHLVMICSASDRITKQAAGVARSLLHLNIQSKQLTSLAAQAIENIPHISAVGYFKISRRIIPQV